MTEIALFIRKKTAFSINQIFETLTVEIGKSVKVRSVDLKKSGAGIPKIIANIAEARRHAVSGINHITGDVHYLVLGLFKGCTVLTIHDCILLHRTPRRHPKYWVYLWFWYKLPVLLADVVTTISEKSKKEIIAFTNCNPDKIVVIPNFVHEIYHYAFKPFDAICPRILHIGTFPNKNLESVTEALSGIPCVLEIIGELAPDHLALLQKHGITFENYFNLSLEELAGRYRRSDMVIFASTYEGFGLPVVEAQATGRPVVTSNIEPMPWVAGADGACLVNPFDVVSIRSGIQRVIGDESYRNKLIKNGLENVKRFALNSVAEQYINVYRNLCAG